jgi:hypothetical protein
MMKITEVRTKADAKEFINMARFIYKGDKEWIQPLDKDIDAVFDTKENPNFKSGEATRWLLKSNTNQTIGRIAAFYSELYNKTTSEKTGGIGFFECVDSKDAAHMLFNTACKWLTERGIKAIDGPINFGEKDRFWGLMVSGFKNPSYLETYNPPYYQALFENYGFKKTVEQSTSEITAADFNYERFKRIASRVLQNPDYGFEHYRDIEIEKFSQDFMSIYNQAWAHRPDFTPMTMERVMTTMKALRPILQEDLIWFAYANNEPAGFYINVIDVNQIFKHLHGKMNLWAKIKFLWFKKFGRVNRCRGIVFGVIPKYQNLGLETGMIIKCHEALQNWKYMQSSELAWIGDFNPKMHSLFDALGAKTTKIHYTYQLKV